MGKVYYSQEVVAFLRERLDCMAIEEIRQQAIEAFPTEKVPSRAAVGRFARAERGGVGQDKRWWSLPIGVVATNGSPFSVEPVTTEDALKRIMRQLGAVQSRLAGIEALILDRAKSKGGSRRAPKGS